MKFLRLPNISGTFTNGYGYPIYKNNTDSYILLMDINPGIYTLGALNLNNLPSYLIMNIKVNDVNGVAVGKVYESSLYASLGSGTIPIWNGTSVESESAQIPVIDRSDRQFLPKYIPPQYSLSFDLLTSLSSFSVLIAGWGFLLEETDEVKI